MASRGAPRPWWCLWISDPVFDERLIVDAETGCKVTLVKERILPDGPEQYPAAIGPAFKPGLLHYFEVKITSARPGERVSFRMGVCCLPQEDPEDYLGECNGEASFSFDDGDTYTGGERFHAVAWR